MRNKDPIVSCPPCFRKDHFDAFAAAGLIVVQGGIADHFVVKGDYYTADYWADRGTCRIRGRPGAAGDLKTLIEEMGKTPEGFDRARGWAKAR